MLIKYNILFSYYPNERGQYNFNTTGSLGCDSSAILNYSSNS